MQVDRSTDDVDYLIRSRGCPAGETSGGKGL
jgi:hypothetical protein